MRRVAASGLVSLAAIVAIVVSSARAIADTPRAVVAKPARRASRAAAKPTAATRTTPSSHTTSYANGTSADLGKSASDTHSDTGPYASAGTSPTTSYANDRDAARVAAPFRPAHRFAVTVNALPLAVGRYGGDLELALLAHHAIVASVFVQTFPGWMLRALTPSGVPATDATTTRLGGELGWRLYTSSAGAEGLFAGVSAITMPIVQARLAEDLHADLVTVTAFGGAFDVGVQAMTSAGFTIGGGLGVMALAYARPAPAPAPPGVDAPSFPAPHVLPRILFATGWAF